MSGPKHTPGPWWVLNANEGDGHPRPLWTVEGGDPRTYYEPSHELADPPYLRAEMHYGVHADAVLMAAAPDLLEALEALVAQSLDSGHPHDWLRHEIDRAKAAIAKAKGEQP